jgi:chromosomal replication initiator protein
MTALDANRIWQQALAELQLQMRREDFQTWFHDAELTSYDGATCFISAENPFTVEWLGSKCRGPVSRALAGVLGGPVEVKFSVRSAESPVDPAPPLLLDSVPAPRERQRSRPPLRSHPNGPAISPRFNFGNFVVGPSNQLAHAACVAVSEGGPLAPNPLFIYGKVGLGKTHLLHSIGHRGVQDGLEVAYVTSESFTNEFIDAVGRSRMDAFRARYRKVDLLLVDDIQFIAGKEQTQEEFFHTFNAVVDAGGHIVLSCDRPPKLLSTLAERLQSRFSWGLVADIQEPDLETRMAILRSKLAGRQAREIPDDVIAFIAERVAGNVRELEGALNRVFAEAEMLQVAPDMALAVSAMESTLPVPGPQAADPDAMIKAVCRTTGVSRRAIEGKGRDKRSAHARHLAMYLLREQTDLSLADIGQLLGDRDHSTVLHGHAKIATAVATDAALRQTLSAVKDMLTVR